MVIQDPTLYVVCLVPVSLVMIILSLATTFAKVKVCFKETIPGACSECRLCRSNHLGAGPVLLVLEIELRYPLL